MWLLSEYILFLPPKYPPTCWGDEEEKDNPFLLTALHKHANSNLTSGGPI